MKTAKRIISLVLLLALFVSLIPAKVSAAETAPSEGDPIQITVQPQSMAAPVGGKITTEVVATGEGLSYQWYFKNAGSTRWYPSSISSAVYSTTMKALFDGRTLYCRVTDKNGNYVDSDMITVTMSEPVRITEQPESVTVPAGSKINTKVVATGEGLRYQWYFKNAGSSNWYKSSITSATYYTTMKSAFDGRTLYCRVTDKYGNFVDSDLITVTMGNPAQITVQPESVVVPAGSEITTKVEATGDGLRYQWYYKKPGNPVWYRSASTTETYSATMKASYNGRQLYCKVTDQYGNSVNSEVVDVILGSAVQITEQPKSEIVPVGNRITAKVVATGDGLSYQWYFKNAGSSRWYPSSITSAAYNTTMRSAFDGRQLYCRVTDKYGNYVDSDVITVAVSEPVRITEHPESVTVPAGSKINTKVVATGEGLRYQWYFKNAGSSNWYKSSITSATYYTTMKSAFDGRTLYCRVTDKYGNFVDSDLITVTMGNPAQITVQPESVVVPAGSEITTKVEATGDGLSYQWYYKKAGGTVWYRSASTTETYSATMKASYDGRQLYCKVTDQYGNSVNSEVVDVILGEDSEDLGTVVASGDCGANGDNVTWTFYSSGLLKLEGSGSMADYNTPGNVPWCDYRYEITAVKIGKDITNIGSYAFYGCNLTGISIPQGVTSIGDYAFASCRNLTCISIPGSITFIGESAFLNCAGLTQITVADNNTCYSSDEQGILYNKAKTELIAAPGGMEGYVIIPSGVTKIGNDAFYGCRNLTGINIPASVISIGKKAFFGCPNLSEISLPLGVASIGERAFYSCESLTNIYIPESVTAIGEGAFENCFGLTQITVADNNTCYSSDSQGFLYNKNQTELIASPCGMEGHVTIPSSVTKIGNRAFYGCRGLSGVSFPAGVVSIGDYAFFNCGCLAELSIPEGVTSIGNYAFWGCESLTDIRIPGSVASIGEYAFSRCGFASIHIPDGVTSIGDRAFYGCSVLSGVRIPASVATIGQSAFSGCDAFSVVYFGGSEEQWSGISMGTDNSCLTNAMIYYHKTDSTDIGAYAEMVLDAKKLMRALLYFTGEFETVADIDPESFRKTIYCLAPAQIKQLEDPYAGSIYTYQVSDLDEVSLSYFGVTYDWTQLNDRENIHYYDEATQTVVVKNPYPFVGGSSYKLTSVEKTGDGQCLAVFDLLDLGYLWGTGRIVMQKTEYGYIAVSYTIER